MSTAAGADRDHDQAGNERRQKNCKPSAALPAPRLSDHAELELRRRWFELLPDQVAAEIRRAIADGEAKSGSRLPPARDLAAVLGVNTNTVLRALRLLRDEGLLEFRRGLGVKVTGTPARGAVLAKATDLLQFARHHGYRRDELIELIQQLP